MSENNPEVNMFIHLTCGQTIAIDNLRRAAVENAIRDSARMGFFALNSDIFIPWHRVHRIEVKDA